jgi:hypothetical protein
MQGCHTKRWVLDETTVECTPYSTCLHVSAQIEVNPLSKEEIKFSPSYRKVPIAMLDGEQINDSVVILVSHWSDVRWRFCMCAFVRARMCVSACEF